MIIILLLLLLLLLLIIIIIIIIINIIITVSTNGHLSTTGTSSTRATFTCPGGGIVHTLTLLLTSLQRQRPLKHVPNCENYLSTTASFLQRLTKKPRVVTKFAPSGVLKINRIFIVFHLHCCSKQKLLTIFIANATHLDPLVMFTFGFKMFSI